MKAVIMAGGKGTRISSINSEVSKTMIKILNKPILEYQIECLRDQGIQEFIIIIGYLGDSIKTYFKDGADFNVKISYITEKEPLGTAGALFFLKNEIVEDFLLLNGDVVFDIDLQKFISFHKNKKGLASIFTHPNNHPYDSGIIISNNNSLVLGWLHKEEEREWYKNRVNAGIHLLSYKILERFDILEKKDLDRDVLKPLIQEKMLFSYDSPEYVKDMGTPYRYSEVTEDIKNNKVHQKNLLQKQRAIFLDRDGTVNTYVGFLNKIEDFTLIDGVAEAIKDVNDSEYLVIIVTNQPVIARGEVTSEELIRIHNKMETLLGMQGAYVDDIFYCPHHPNSGYEGEIKEYKCECSCRKPKPGMLIEASLKYNIDLAHSWMIGDNDSDVMAGYQAGCKTIKIGHEVKNLKQAIKYCLGMDGY